MGRSGCSTNWVYSAFFWRGERVENGFRHLNRKSCVAEILNALEILNDFDVHIAYNLLMFEPDTALDDILVNLRFMERHIENPFNFCRAEAYPGTGLESKLVAEGRLLGDSFGYDYRISDPRSEAFHQIANYAFFDRNFSDFGLHYFNMQVDFYFQLLRRFHPELLTQSLRAAVRNFIKHTNLDTYECVCGIYDFVAKANPSDQARQRGLPEEMLESCRATTSHSDRVTYQLGDFRADDFGNQYDVIVASLSLHHLTRSERPAFFNRAYASLAGGGILIAAEVIVDESPRHQRAAVSALAGVHGVSR